MPTRFWCSTVAVSSSTGRTVRFWLGEVIIIGCTPCSSRTDARQRRASRRPSPPSRVPKPSRVRVLFYYSPAEWSGSARAFATAAVAMAGRGYQCTFVCRADSAVEERLTPGTERLPGVELTPAPLGGPWMHESLRLRQVLLEHYVEVVFVHSEREQLVASLDIRLAERAALVRRIPAGARLVRGPESRLGERLAATGYLHTAEHGSSNGTAPVGAFEPVASDIGVSIESLEQVRPVALNAVVAPGGDQLIACVYDPTARRRAASLLRAVALLAPR